MICYGLLFVALQSKMLYNKLSVVDSLFFLHMGFVYQFARLNHYANSTQLLIYTSSIPPMINLGFTGGYILFI